MPFPSRSVLDAWDLADPQPAPRSGLDAQYFVVSHQTGPAWLRRQGSTRRSPEVTAALCAHLAATGLPVCQPIPTRTSGWSHGIWTLWREVPGPPATPDDYPALGALLARVHALPLIGLPRRPSLEPDLLAHLTPAERSLLAGYPNAIAHLDVHLYNAIASTSGLVLLDWFNAGLVPAPFDLAVAVVFAYEHTSQSVAAPLALLDGYGPSLRTLAAVRDLLPAAGSALARRASSHHHSLARRFADSGPLLAALLDGYPAHRLPEDDDDS